jgi:ubiquinone/menaquinone biosynthesis C-methylase UbiE
LQIRDLRVEMSIELRLALQERRSDDLAQRVRRLLGPFTGNEGVLDAGCGTGAVAFALAPNVAEVVAVDTRVDYLQAGRESAPANVRFEEADVMSLPFGYAEFDIVCCHRVLHHVRRPELAVSELARVARSGGKVFIADQLGSVDPLLSLEQDRFEHLRDATHQRLLPEADIRGYLDANDLVLISSEVTRERVDLEERLELAGFDEEERIRIRGPAPATPYDIEVGWYVSRKPGP